MRIFLAALCALIASAGCSYYSDPALREATVHSTKSVRSGDGFQTVDTDNPTFMPGEYVEITPDGRVLRISATTLNR